MSTWNKRKWMLFVDGENLTFRGQKFISEQKLAFAEGTYCKKDVFIWMANPHPLNVPDDASGHVYTLEERALRAYYYTSAVGSEEHIAEIRTSLWKIGFTPKVFKKPKKEEKSKGVDIALCTDMLTHAFQNHFDAAVLMTGDADYRPLIGRVKSLGKSVYLWFFESAAHGMSPELKVESDGLIEL